MNNLNTETSRAHSYRPEPFLSSLPLPAGPASEQLTLASLRNVFASLSTPSSLARREAKTQGPATGLEERLYDALASFKLKTAAVAMHLTADERLRLFRQLDSLMAADTWDPDDAPTTLGSFSTLLRMVLFLGGRRPALGATSTGNFIASWTEGADRLTIECKPDDQVRWVLVQDLDGERESAAGETTTRRLLDVLRPYDAPNRWFPDGAD